MMEENLGLSLVNYPSPLYSLRGLRVPSARGFSLLAVPQTVQYH